MIPPVAPLAAVVATVVASSVVPPVIPPEFPSMIFQIRQPNYRRYRLTAQKRTPCPAALHRRALLTTTVIEISVGFEEEEEDEEIEDIKKDPEEFVSEDENDVSS